MSYVDGFVAAVPAANKETYRAHAERTAALFRECGATEVRECWGDDVPPGTLTSFPLAVKLQDGEQVALGWIVWPSKAVRDAAWARLMADDRMKNEQMPFDGKRMIYGGFEVILTA
jgi:uncharacterized protein YbaA (DUF1428 family)